MSEAIRGYAVYLNGSDHRVISVGMTILADTRQDAVSKFEKYLQETCNLEWIDLLRNPSIKAFSFREVIVIKQLLLPGRALLILL